jgi:hypothetical protein
MTADDVLAALAISRTAARTLSENTDGLRSKQWGHHLRRHDSAVEQVAAVYAERDALQTRLKEVSDICREVYQKTPMLPVDELTMEGATDALNAFCLMLGIVGIDISDEALARSKGGAS